MIIPGLLQSGDKVGILAPARKINPFDVDYAANVLSKWGVQVVLSRNLFSEKHSYLSGTDEQRLADLQSMVNDPELKAIFCARGGYGSSRIVDEVDFSPLVTNPKWIIGFSDITAIHLKAFSQNVASIHGTMPVLFSKPDSIPSIESLRKVLFDGSCEIGIAPSGYNRRGKTTGMVMGGNLSLLVDALGSSAAPDTNGRILIIEEVDEYLYKIDRMMTQLRRSHKLAGLKGLIVGHMTDIKDTELSFGESVEEIILNAVKEYTFPVAFKFPSGHENPNLAWVNGGIATFDVNETSVSLNFQKLQRSASKQGNDAILH